MFNKTKNNYLICKCRHSEKKLAIYYTVYTLNTC